MQTTEWRRIPETIGDNISPEYYRYLADGYAQEHPTEQKSVHIPREYILETLEKFPAATGLRFMYGQKDGADPGSRTIVLMACDSGSVDRHVPNIILMPKGYITDAGDRITLDECWNILTRHVDRMCSLLPGEARKEIPRGVFFGISSMKSLLNTPGCAGIQFHFGYNPATEIRSERYESVMEAVDKDLKSLNVFTENGSRCPTVCGGGIVEIPVGWPFSSAYEGQVPEGALFEMFHHVSPPLFGVIQDKQIYREQFSECQALVDAGNYPEARQALRRRLDDMMEKYLFGNQ